MGISPIPRPAPHTYMHSLSHYQHLPPECTYIITNEATLTCHYYREQIVYIRVNAWCVHFMVLEQCILTCIQHYSIRESMFTSLKILCVRRGFFFFFYQPGWSWRAGPWEDRSEKVRDGGPRGSQMEREQSMA